MPVTSQKIARYTTRCFTLRLTLDFTQKGWPSYIDNADLKPFFHKRHEQTVHQSCLMFGMSVVVPPKLPQLVIEELLDV